LLSAIHPRVLLPWASILARLTHSRFFPEHRDSKDGE